MRRGVCVTGRALAPAGVLMLWLAAFGYQARALDAPGPVVGAPTVQQDRKSVV